ncbi:hypothetical protein CVT25_004790 [Psilocybe cyanescens]|uniref:SHSP domain-containing protein n=1 Tax=Psilocybe cyanescens TaxID=93625 RepID=A0A409VZP2_PSICY|nr:hypothetical protein CVT25_004790 [Psilocybe cyanescens]
MASVEFPGAAKEDIRIEVHNGKLTVPAETKTLQLQQGVKDEEIAASVENGILTIALPKSASELAPKKITTS